MAELFSDLWSDADRNELPIAVVHAVRELEGAFGAAVSVKLNGLGVAICLELAVSIPTRGPHKRRDVRPVEPVLIQIDPIRFPHKCPRVGMNRVSFPRDQLPHLYPGHREDPAWLCLHKGSMDEWFAEHTVTDLVERAEHWLRDAARGKLNPPSEPYEPILPRLNDCIFLYENARMCDLVSRGWRRTIGRAGAAFFYTRLSTRARAAALLGSNRYALESVSLELPMEAIPPYRENPPSLVAKLSLDPLAQPDPWLHRRKHVVEGRQKLGLAGLWGVVLWPDINPIDAYNGDLPTSYEELVAWCDRVGIPMARVMRTYISQGWAIDGILPLVIALPRPRIVLGSAEAIEFVSFVVLPPQDPKELIDVGHRQPMTRKKAARLSRSKMSEQDQRWVVLGCGALGSMIALGRGRAGHADLDLVDNDRLEPHNLARHALSSQYLGASKATAMADEIKAMFTGEEVKPRAFDMSAQDFVLDHPDVLTKAARVLDMSASAQVLELLCDAAIGGRVARAEIALYGLLGVLTQEGPDRNPRIDEIRVGLFDSAVDSPEGSVALWLQHHRSLRDKGGAYEEIIVGLSCSSDTMRISGDMISWHANSFSMELRQPTPEHGSVLLTQPNPSEPAKGSINRMSVLPWRRLGAAGSSWDIRIAGSALDFMREQLREKAPNETGGVLFGMVHPKKNILYVTRADPAPPDSIEEPTRFVRGVAGVAQSMSAADDATGGLIQYVGDWHSHPDGPAGPSLEDISTGEELRTSGIRGRVPAHILIVTEDKVCSCVFPRQGGYIPHS